jgi:hypothetical protein
MKATIFCDDSSFAVNSRALLRRVGNRSAVNVKWAVKTWPINALHHPSLSERALSESADAHLIVIPGKHARALSTHLRDWLNHWAVLRQLGNAAVGVIDEADGSGARNEISLELRLLVARHGLNLIHDEAGVNGGATKLSERFPLEPEQPLPIGSAHLTNTPMIEVFRGYGINE